MAAGGGGRPARHLATAFRSVSGAGADPPSRTILQSDCAWSPRLAARAGAALLHVRQRAPRDPRDLRRRRSVSVCVRDCD